MINVSQSREYIVDNDGNFRFTKNGLKEQAPLLAKAGIDARTIKTYSQYLQARKKASPYFMEYLQECLELRLGDAPNTLEVQALRSLVYGTKEDQEKMIQKMKKRKLFKIV